jgi:hypothetical protein
MQLLFGIEKNAARNVIRDVTSLGSDVVRSLTSFGSEVVRSLTSFGGLQKIDAFPFDISFLLFETHYICHSQ